MKPSYIHIEFPEISSDFLKDGDVVLKPLKNRSVSEIMNIAVLTMKLAQLIGIKLPQIENRDTLPYDQSTDNLIFSAPLASAMLGRKINFLRGWKQFESCIKGCNALGLMAEQVHMTLQSLNRLRMEQIVNLKKTFLKSRKIRGSEEFVFHPDEVDSASIEQFAEIGLVPLAAWKAFSNHAIVCSTSSNMGISLHDALRYMQRTKLSLFGKEFTLLNEKEGKLIIWCPDEEADFMNSEKSAFLSRLEAEKPKLTSLRTYINRQQRDPGALRDALICGGYFFPTNPQSKDELQNLLYVALTNIAVEKGQSIPKLLDDPNIIETLESLRAERAYGKVYVTEGVEGGIAGLMVPYLIMLEELLPQSSLKGISTWNQASIGAALAAAVLADMMIRQPDQLSEQTRSDLYSLFPNICKFQDHNQLGRSVRTSVHGVFDIANLQSLAQLLGVVVEKHLSGRGTAYVGLGSSSYSNGNRCYEILKQSSEENGPFQGKTTFHPSTHTLNPMAQALIYGEDIFRCQMAQAGRDFKTVEERTASVRPHVRKPEPAGAAALAGYLLARLDSGTLSLIEIAYAMRIMGFTKNLFLKFRNLPDDERGSNQLLQECYEEGIYMGDLVKNILIYLDWPVGDLGKKAVKERAFSRLKYVLTPLDDSHLDNLNPQVNIYLTGDNTSQPDDEILRDLVEAQIKNLPFLNKYVEDDRSEDSSYTTGRAISFLNGVSARVSSGLKNLDRRFDHLAKGLLNALVMKKIRKLSEDNRRN